MRIKPLMLIAVAALSFVSPAFAQSPRPFDNPGAVSDPVQGEVGSLQRFTITFENQRGVFPNPYQHSISVTRYGEEEVLMSATAKNDNTSYNVLHVTLDRTLRDPGSYVITLPAGFLQDWDYNELPETKWLYTVTGGTPDNPDFKPYDNAGVCISPRQGVYNKIGEDFRLNFDYPSVGVNPAKMIRMFDDENGTVCGTFSIDYTFTDDGKAVLNQFVLRSDREITAPGSYTLEFPDGTFYTSADGEDMGGFKFRYAVAEDGAAYTPDPSYSFVTPSSGSTLRSLSSIIVTFPDFDKIRPAVKTDIKVTDVSGAVVATGMPVGAQDGVAKNQMTVNFQPAVTAEGNYTVTLAGSTFIIGDNGSASDEIVLSYTLKENAYDPNDPDGPYDNRGVSIYPEQGTYRSLNTFTLTFDCDKTGINYSKMVKVYNDETGAIFGTCGIDYGANFGKEVTVDVLPWMNVPGSYTIEFLKGTFYDYGDPDEPEMPTYKFRYIIDPQGKVVTPVTENVTASPASGSTIGPLETLTVKFPDFTRIERSRTVDNLNVEIKVVDSKGEVVSEGAVNPSRGDLAPNEMQIQFNPTVIYTGEYDIVFARRIFLLGEEGDQRFNEDFTLHYSILGAAISTVGTDNPDAPAEYFNLQGIRVSDPAPGTLLLRRLGNKVEKIIF